MKISCLDNRIVHRFMSYGMVSEDKIMSSVQYLRIPVQKDFTQEHLNSIIFPIIDRYMARSNARMEIESGLPIEVINQFQNYGIDDILTIKSMCEDVLDFARTREQSDDVNYLLIKYVNMYLYYLERGEYEYEYSCDDFDEE